MNEFGRWLSNQRFIKGFTLFFYLGARLSEKLSFHRSNGFPLSVVHISPCYFSDRSLIGGGERYVTALAEAMSRYVNTTLVSFSSARDSYRQGNLKIEIYPAMGDASNPLSYSFLPDLRKADVIHCHQYYKYVTNLAIPVGASLGKRVFVSDHGGNSSRISDRIPLANAIDGFLLVSAFSAKSLPRAKRSQVVYGGVGEEFLLQKQVEKQNQVLFVGRILPHKGINYLIEAVGKDIPLEIIGRVYDNKYFSLLQELAKDKNVKFITDANDEATIAAYRSALVTVLPSVYKDINAMKHPAPELLGLVLLESMACGTPVICTNVGGMPEIVRDGVTGFIVPPNDPIALREKIHWLLDHPDQAAQMGQQARSEVLKNFTWDSVAKRCLEAYQK
jgi:glycosyltransferase involved in cell wall biosynthesis